MTKLIKQILTKVSLSEKSSTIIFKDKEYPIKKFVVAICKKYDIDLQDFTTELTKYLDALKKDYIIKAQLLNDPSSTDLSLWNPFKIWSDGTNCNIFVNINSDTNTYDYIDLPKGGKTVTPFVATLYNYGNDGIKIHHKLENIRKDILLNASDYLFKKPIGFEYDNKSKELSWKKYPDTLSDYFNNSYSKMIEQSGLIFNELPVPFTNDPNIPNMGFFNTNAIKAENMDTPNWDSFLTQFRKDQKEVFMAYVYSIFDAKNRGRQLAYIRSKGYDGKTFAINAISDFLGERNHTSLKTEQITSQFFGSFIFGKRMAIWDDCKNPAIFKYGNIRSFSGNGKIPIEYKGKTSFSAQVHVKMIITSNYAPIIDISDRSEKTRVLYFELVGYPDKELKKFMKVDSNNNLIKDDNGDYIPDADGSFQDKLYKEMPAFLIKCKEMYAKICPKFNDINNSKEMLQDLLNHCQSDDHIEFENIFNQYFTIGEEEDFMTNKDINKIFVSFLDEKKFIKFCRYLTNIDIKPYSKKIDGKTYRGRLGIKLKEKDIFSKKNNPMDSIINDVEEL